MQENWIQKLAFCKNFHSFAFWGFFSCQHLLDSAAWAKKFCQIHVRSSVTSVDKSENIFCVEISVDLTHFALNLA